MSILIPEKKISLIEQSIFILRLLLYVAIIFSSTDLFSQSLESESGFLTRSHSLTVQTADCYKPPPLKIEDPEKYYWPKVIARFDKYGPADNAGNNWIEQLKNRSPFHFTLVGMARIMSLYPEAPAIRENKVLLLKKVFERHDSYNAFTSEGTENHINMSRTSGYIFAQHALEYPNQFPDAKKKLELMKNWIIEWSKTIFTYGTGEWNSSIYETYNVIGWLNIYDFARDPEVKDAARAVLDYYASELALHYSWGTPGGTEMRGSGAENLNTNATRYLCWIWFGRDSESESISFKGSQYIQCMHAVTSTYRPPYILYELAGKINTIPSWYINSKPSYLFKEPSFVKQFFYISENFTLGSCISPYGGWTGSTYQMVNWRLVVKPGKGNSPFEVGGNGRFYDNMSGKTTNPFTQIVQNRNVLIQMTLTPENAEEISETIQLIVKKWSDSWEKDFQNRFPRDEKTGIVKINTGMIKLNESYITLPEAASSIEKDNHCVISLGNVYLGITTLSGKDINGISQNDENSNRLYLFDKASPGNLCGFIIEVAEKGKYTSPKIFLDSLSSVNRIDKSRAKDGLISYRAIDGTTISAQYCSTGRYSEAISDWGYGVSEQMVFIKAPPFRQPEWPTIRGLGRIPRFWVNGVESSFGEAIPVFNGPDLKLDKGLLEISNNRQVYRVDYSGSLPVFSTIASE